MNDNRGDIDVQACEDMLQDVLVRDLERCKQLLFYQTVDVIDKMVDAVADGALDIPAGCSYGKFRDIVFGIGGKDIVYGKRTVKKITTDYAQVLAEVERLKKEEMLLQYKVEGLRNKRAVRAKHSVYQLNLL